MSTAWGSKERVEEWRHLATARNAALAAVTERLLEGARIGEGMRVLVLGAGTGDDTAIVAERTGPRGRIVATDLSPAMVQACAETMTSLGAAHVQCRVMDAAAVDVAPGTFDAVVSRNGLMFTPRFDLALAGARRALRPGGRFAMSSWAELDRNAFHGTLVEIARRFGSALEDVEIMRAYSLCAPDTLAADLRKAGCRRRDRPARRGPEAVRERGRGDRVSSEGAHRRALRAASPRPTARRPGRPPPVTTRASRRQLDSSSRARAW
jgi:SAM-dependent methyltransferase